MRNLENYDVIQLTDNESLKIEGGSEKHAYYFGIVCRYSLAAALGGPVGVAALGIYDYFN